LVKVDLSFPAAIGQLALYQRSRGRGRRSLSTGCQPAESSPSNMPAAIDFRKLRAVQKLPFCYICGKSFAKDDQRNRDHVPSSSCIPIRNRPRGPIILPVHKACNDHFKKDDEQYAIEKLIDPAGHSTRTALRPGGAPEDRAHFDRSAQWAIAVGQKGCRSRS
jgi:hypothetical protein